MRLHPMPVLMVSTLTERGSEVTLRARWSLARWISSPKPKVDISHGMKEYAAEIIDKLRVAAQAKIRRQQPLRSPRN